jgi:hypothetical protein
MRAIGTDVRQVTDNKWEVEGRVRSSDSNLLNTNAATHPDTMMVRIQCQENALRPGDALRASGRPLADRFARIDADSPFANGLLFDVFDRQIALVRVRCRAEDDEQFRQEVEPSIVLLKVGVMAGASAC